MKDHYFVMQHKRGVGWVAACQPSCFKSARALRDKLSLTFGKGRAMLVKVVE